MDEFTGIINRLRSKATLHLNMGCGDALISGAINCDFRGGNQVIKMDITNPSVNDFGDVCLIESHHAIEHLPMNVVEPTLERWYAALKVGGHLIITCPDLELVVQKWLDSDRAFGNYEMKMLFGSQEHDGMYHKCGFTKRIMIDMLTRIGFRIHITASPWPKRPTPSLLVIAEKL